MKRNIKELDIQELKTVVQGWGEPGFRAQQIFEWMYRKCVEDFGAMSSLSVGLRKKLADNFKLYNLSPKKELISKDKTRKFLLELDDNNTIEAVLIPADQRVTGCISSQVGCKFACTFCCSGALGFIRNLSREEIIDQVCFLKQRSGAAKLTHIVFMGMGEPLDNYDNVLSAIRFINSAQGLGIGSRRITISTCGLVPQIKRLAQEALQVELSVSLHSGNDAQRCLLMPVNKRYPLKELISCCREYIKDTNRQVTFEYSLIKGVNSSLQDAEKLVKLLAGLNCKVNLIALNPQTKQGLVSASGNQIGMFRKYLVEHGLHATLRRSRGQDIQAACGQLSSSNAQK